MLQRKCLVNYGFIFSHIAKWMKTCGRKCVNTALIENIGIKKAKFLQNSFHVMT